MRYLLTALCAFGLAACGDTTNPDSSGGLEGVPLDQVAELGLECESGKYAQYRKIEGDLCVPNAPAFDDLIADCKLIANAGCLPIAVGCGYAPVIVLLGSEEGAQIEGRHVPGFERRTADFETVWAGRKRGEDLLRLPSIGDLNFHAGLEVVSPESKACVNSIRSEMTALGQWVWRDQKAEQDRCIEFCVQEEACLARDCEVAHEDFPVRCRSLCGHSYGAMREVAMADTCDESWTIIRTAGILECPSTECRDECLRVASCAGSECSAAEQVYLDWCNDTCSAGRFLDGLKAHAQCGDLIAAVSASVPVLETACD